MFMKKTRSLKNTKKSSKGHVITLLVQNGPFTSKENAQKACAVLQGTGVHTTAPVKTTKGYKFKSKLNYRVPSVDLKTKVIAALRKKAKASGIASSAISITSRKL